MSEERFVPTEHDLLAAHAAGLWPPQITEAQIHAARLEGRLDPRLAASVSVEETTVANPRSVEPVAEEPEVEEEAVEAEKEEEVVAEKPAKSKKDETE